MKKVPTLFVRDMSTHQLTAEVHPDAAWVVAGEGVATRKFDGTPVLIREGAAFKRVTLSAKPGKPRPPGWIEAQADPDPETGEWPGWAPVGEGKEDALFREGLAAPLPRAGDLPDGTYELVGPKINGNPEGLSEHRLVPHGEAVLQEVPTDPDGLRAFLAAHSDIEGVVWHHPDGRMAKIKGKDFGLHRSRS